MIVREEDLVALATRLLDDDYGISLEAWFALVRTDSNQCLSEIRSRVKITEDRVYVMPSEVEAAK